MRATISLLLLLLFAVNGPAAPPAGDLKTMRPNPDDEPTVVKVGVFLRDIQRINDADETVDAEMMLYLSWLDSRLASPSGKVRLLPIDDIWSPRIDFLTTETVAKKTRDDVQVHPDGTVVYRQRLSGRFEADFDLHDFPGDAQILSFRIAFPDYSPEVLKLEVDQKMTGDAGSYSLPDWEVEPGSCRVVTSELVPGHPSAAVVYRVEVGRRLPYYVWKLMLPLLLIVIMSWGSFWLEPGNIGPQLGVATSAVLSLIAYRFMLSTQLPRISYLTRMDLFVLASTVIVFLAFIEVIITSVLTERGHLALVRKMDIWSRGLFPLLFIGYCAYLCLS